MRVSTMVRIAGMAAVAVALAACAQSPIAPLPSARTSGRPTGASASMTGRVPQPDTSRIGGVRVLPTLSGYNVTASNCDPTVDPTCGS